MIQVCSSCGTRWNVRDKQRTWCPRCQGALLPPSQLPTGATPGVAAGSAWGRPAAGPGPGAPNGASPAPGTPRRPPPGYRWIAVRPGAPPPPRPRGRHLGPTPRYSEIPRWSLPDTPDVLEYRDGPVAPRPAVSSRLVHRVLTTTAAVFGVAALVYLLRYALLLVNRSTLLHPLIAGTVVVLGILASLAAIAAMITCWVVMTRWLIERRAAAYAHRGIDDPRKTSALWLGCMLPLVNLFWAPVYVIETATLEGLYSRLRRDILTWWLWWVLSAVVSGFAIIWLFSFDWYFFGVRIALNSSAQGIADNTVAMICAYLVGAAAVLALARVYRGFDGKPVHQSAHRWILVAADEKKPADETDGKSGTGAAGSDLAAAVEPQGQEPAA